MGFGNEAWDRTGSFRAGRPLVRFGAIEEGWELYRQRWGVWVLTTLIVIACNTVVLGLLYSVLRVAPDRGVGGFRAPLRPEGQALEAILSMIVNGFFLGGMFRLACRQIRGREIGVDVLWSVTDVLPNLVIGSALYGMAVLAGSFCFFIPGLIVSGLLMFTIPLIVDAGLAPVEAITTSWNALKGQWLTATVFHLATWLLAGVGGLCCCVGLLVTAPLYTLAISVLYRDFFLRKGSEFVGKPEPSGWDE